MWKKRKESKSKRSNMWSMRMKMEERKCRGDNPRSKRSFQMDDMFWGPGTTLTTSRTRTAGSKLCRNLPACPPTVKPKPQIRKMSTFIQKAPHTHFSPETCREQKG